MPYSEFETNSNMNQSYNGSKNFFLNQKDYLERARASDCQSKTFDQAYIMRAYQTARVGNREQLKQSMKAELPANSIFPDVNKQ